jgi:hypothetical protein
MVINVRVNSIRCHAVRTAVLMSRRRLMLMSHATVVMNMVPVSDAMALHLVLIRAAAAHGRCHRALDRDRECQQPNQRGSDEERHIC